MRWFMLYWLIGCLTLGAAQAILNRDCKPASGNVIAACIQIGGDEAIGIIVAWPAMIGYGAALLTMPAREQAPIPVFLRPKMRVVQE